jgi:sterol desaturase/sphingolipid hydroxylase (fatty acid hydroxylase superfamily)
MTELLTWVMTRTSLDAALFSLLGNIATFCGALTFGEMVTRNFSARRVTPRAPPVTRAELWLTFACVLCNTIVTFTGWRLVQLGFIHVVPDAPWWRVVLDVVLLVLVMDLAMYVTHRLAHVPVFYRWVHRIHHRYEHPRPLTLFVLHPIEVFGFGALWLLVLLAHDWSLFSIGVYLGINLVFGALGHVGVEPFPRALLRLPLGTSTFHAKHHTQPHGSFGFYTQLWDRLFGTLN